MKAGLKIQTPHLTGSSFIDKGIQHDVAQIFVEKIIDWIENVKKTMTIFEMV